MWMLGLAVIIGVVVLATAMRSSCESQEPDLEMSHAPHIDGENPSAPVAPTALGTVVDGSPSTRPTTSHTRAA